MSLSLLFPPKSSHGFVAPSLCEDNENSISTRDGRRNRLTGNFCCTEAFLSCKESLKSPLRTTSSKAQNCKYIKYNLLHPKTQSIFPLAFPSSA